MNSSILTKFPAVLLVALLLAVPLCLLATGQVTTIRPFPIGQPSVLPADIVDLAGTAFPAPFGGSSTVYTVPANKWLIVTDVEVIVPTGPNAISVDLVEDTGPAQLKRDSAFNVPSYPGYHSSVGLAFQPGSDVDFVNISGMAGSVTYTITGRLANP
jgi:hypothetical protein